MAPFALGLLPESAAAAPPEFTEVAAVAVTGSTASLKANIVPNLLEKETSAFYRIEYGAEDCKISSCTVVKSGSISVAMPVETFLEGLNPNTLYHFRVAAEHTTGIKEESLVDSVFFTRTGVSKGLPDNRAYEQASPVDKDGGDLQGDLALIKAAEGGITFESTFGVPGGKGAQEFPTYFASRGSGQWSSEGLLPPFSAGQRAQVVGWSPDFTEVFSAVTRLGELRKAALIVQRGSADPVTVAPYTAGGFLGAGAEYFYAGQSKDGSVVLFESPSKLVENAIEGSPNLYAWDRDTGQLALAGIDNHGVAPAKGTRAGAYLWVLGSSGRALRLGGSEFGMYLRDERAVSPDGSIVFTEAGSGQLYRRINPTIEQSSTKVNGKCQDPAKACTIHISASHKTNGEGEGGTDAAGPQPAAFQAASADGSEVFFTSPEKLTDNANTGPEQSLAQIELGTTAGTIEKAKFIAPQRALGVAVDSQHVYWVDPARESIGRSDLNGEHIEPEFVIPGTIKCEVEGEPGIFEEVESTPRYVAVNAEHVYWTNTGCLNEDSEPIEATGTIGRASIAGGEVTDIKPEFVRGASNPQGIAVNSEHIYWANAGKSAGVRAIGWATTEEGEEVNQKLIPISGNGPPTPYGVVLSPTRVYYSGNEDDEDRGFVRSLPLSGNLEEQKSRFIGKEGIRGLAVDSEHVYWASQGEEAIGRSDLELTLESKENEFIKLSGKPTGLALGGTHLYWSTNGEAPTNPGNDLYRYGPEQGELTDLTPDPDGNGAEVQGVLGVSTDGKYVYFAANGVLDVDGEAKEGTCEGPLVSASGSCNLYLWHEGEITLIARLRTGGDELNWVATPRELFGTASYVAKTSFLSADGRTLLFRSQEQLAPYASMGTSEYYRFRVGDPELRCATCSPAGEAAGEGARFGRMHFPGVGPLAGGVAAVSARVLSADGNKAFFETTESLVPEDINAQDGCENVGKGEQLYFSCIDTYEWEAPGTPSGTCTESSPAYSPINAGCVYLLSTGKSQYPSLFADASPSGDDVFFFTRDQFVGQDKDEIQDVYDARLGGGLVSQNPPPTVPCEAAESCHGPAPTPPAESSPATPNFHGPVNPKPVHKKPNKHKRKKHKRKKGHKRAATKGRTPGRSR
jgi:hypothetical protein